jgi:hypothetical protein
MQNAIYVILPGTAAYFPREYIDAKFIEEFITVRESTTPCVYATLGLVLQEGFAA